MNASSMAFVTELGRRLPESTDNPRETAFLFQRLSIAIQRFNAVLIQESFVIAVISVRRLAIINYPH